MSGFVYIWRDRGKDRYYIGAHWGQEDDGYICSSNWMRVSYQRRPQDFRRRILSRHATKEELWEAEYQWLKLIPQEVLGKIYYNKAAFKHQTTAWNKGIKTGPQSPEQIEKHRARMLGNTYTKGKHHKKKRAFVPFTEERREKARLDR